jgi:hypothetical protein
MYIVGDSNMEDNGLQVTAMVKPEALHFFEDHGCIVRQQRGADTIIFPAGSRKEKLSATSKRCSHIILPDNTTITAIEGETICILLLIDLSKGQTTHLTN